MASNKRAFTKAGKCKKYKINGPIYVVTLGVSNGKYSRTLHAACRSTLRHESLCLLTTYGYSATNKTILFFV